MFSLLKRCAETVIKLPVAAAWDLASLGNMGEGSSTAKVLREHEAKKQLDDFAEAVKRVREIQQ